MAHRHDWIQVVFGEYMFGLSLHFDPRLTKTELVFQIIEYSRLKAVVFCEDGNHRN